MAEPDRVLLGRHGRLSLVLALIMDSMRRAAFVVLLVCLPVRVLADAPSQWSYATYTGTEYCTGPNGPLGWFATVSDVCDMYAGSGGDLSASRCSVQTQLDVAEVLVSSCRIHSSWLVGGGDQYFYIYPTEGCPDGGTLNNHVCVGAPEPGCEPNEPAPYPDIDFVWNAESCEWRLVQCSTERSWIFKDAWWSQGEETCQWGCNYVADGATGDGKTWFRPGNVACTSDPLGPPEDPSQCGPDEELTAAGTCWPLPCPEGTESLNGQCVYLDCPEGQIHWGEACVLECDWAAGEHMEEGLCLPPETCGPGYTLEGQQCVASEPPEYWVDPEPDPIDPPPGTTPWVPGPIPPGGGDTVTTGTSNTTGSIVLESDGSGGLTGSIDLESTFEFDWGDPGTVQGSVFDSPGMRASMKDFWDRVEASAVVSSVNGLGGLFPTGGTCPLGSIDLFETQISMVPACQYWDDVSPIISFAAHAIWILLAIRVFLEA